MASPAQALWHVSQVVQSLGHAFGSHVPPSLPEQGLLQLSLATFEARDMMLHPFAHTRESLLFQTAVLDKFGVRYTCPPQQAVLTSPGTSAVVDLARETNKRKAADTNGPVHTCHMTPAISPTGGLEFFANKPRNAIIVEQSHPSGHSSLQHQPGWEAIQDHQELRDADALQSEIGRSAVHVMPPYANNDPVRGKGKGGIGPGRNASNDSRRTPRTNDTDPTQPRVPASWNGPPTEATAAKDLPAPSDADRASNLEHQLLQKELFHIVVCRPDCAAFWFSQVPPLDSCRRPKPKSHACPSNHWSLRP